ncbi:hypothetical protein KCU65_g7164, partial [Aureobasidium melanogenum]
MADSNTESVQLLTSISGCTDDEARRWLKVKNNDADAALNAMLDNEDLSKAEQSITWNENDFNAGRDGSTAFGPQNYSYNDQNLRPLGQSAAPTRGNSPAPSLRQPSNKDDEDADLQKAIEASQQTGITLPNTNLKPAMDDHYDPAKWSMTTVSMEHQQASEIIPDLEPHERKNENDEPRFLKPLPSGDYLPSLLTIAHSIPLARKALLAPHKTYSSYGSDSEWWKGHGIRLPKIVSTVDGAPMEPATTNQDEILAEMQRLMAFLDESLRSYGSVETLVRLAEVQPNNGCILDKVIEAWEKASLNAMDGPPDVDSFVFHSLVGTTNPEGMATPDLFSLPLFINSGPGASSLELASIMDDTLWDTDGDESTVYDNFIDHCAHVLPIRLMHNDSSKETLNVVIPPVLYVDKYLKENADLTRDVRRQMIQGKKRIESIEAVQFKLNNYQDAQKGNLDTSQLMKHAQDYFSGETRKNLLEEREGAGAGGDTDIPLPQEHHGAIAEKLDTLYKELVVKLQALEQEKEKARKALAELSQESGLPKDSLKHRYSLRGVSTKTHVTYLLRPRDPSDTAMVDDEDAPEGMQWWRIEYDVQVHGAKVIKTKSTQDDVIRAVELEHNQALLVYASDYAISDEHEIELTSGLDEFIHYDDENFNSELETSGFGHVNVYPAYEGVQQRRDSGDSTAVNFDEGPPGYEPPPYDANVEYGRIQGSKDVPMYEGHSPPIHEIRLEQEEVQQEAENISGVEMVEKVHAAPSVYRFGNDGSKITETVSEDAMTGMKGPDGEADLIDFKD